MTLENKLYRKIQPLLEGMTEGIYWDFKKTLTDTADIIKDILAFSNSGYENDSYIIVGVGESKKKEKLTRIPLSSEDRQRLGKAGGYISSSSKKFLAYS